MRGLARVNQRTWAVGAAHAWARRRMAKTVALRGSMRWGQNKASRAIAFRAIAFRAIARLCATALGWKHHSQRLKTDVENPFGHISVFAEGSLLRAEGTGHPHPKSGHWLTLLEKQTPPQNLSQEHQRVGAASLQSNDRLLSQPFVCVGWVIAMPAQQ